MSFTMSGVEGGWDFNRFDALSEGKGKKKCDKCKGKGCSHCRGTGYHYGEDEDENEGGVEGGDGGDAMSEGKSDRPLGVMHPFARGMKQKRGEKRTDMDSEGNRIGKYVKGGSRAVTKEEVELEEGRKPGESAEDYISRVKGKGYMDRIKKKYANDKPKTYDPMKDPDFDHDKAERTRGSMEEGLDPVGKEDGDVDNDGDKDSSDKYLLKRRKAIAKAMKKEEAELEAFTEKELDLLEDLLGK